MRVQSYEVRNINMYNSKVTTANESMPILMMAIDAKEQLPATTNLSMKSSDSVKLYKVPITQEFQTSLTGYVKVYAASEGEAIAEVQVQIDNETLADDLEMMDFDSGCKLSYAD